MSGKVAVVNGGTGGLGTAVVGSLLAEGWRVHVPWVTEGSRERLAAEHASTEALRMHRADVTDPDAVEALFAAVASEEGGRLDLLCNMVGGFAMAPIADTDPETWRRLWENHATAPFLAIRAALPLLSTSDAGRIVNVAAAAAMGGPVRNMSAYLAAKTAVVSLTRNMALELAPAGITVNAIAPTTIDTPANRSAMPDADRSTWLTPEEIAAVVRFLAGPDGAVVTGSVLELRKG